MNTGEPDGNVPTLREKAERLLLDLADKSPDEIAMYFEASGIRGGRNANDCPVSTYLLQGIGCKHVASWPHSVYVGIDRNGIVPPTSVSKFINRYDAKFYPQLTIAER